MRPVPRRFLIAYAAAFALLWAIGLFVEGRSIHASWTQLPFDPPVKTDYFASHAQVYVLEGRDGSPTEFIAVNSIFEREWPYPESYRQVEPRILGVAEVWRPWGLRVAAPFVMREYHYVHGDYYTYEDRSIAPKDLATAKKLAYREARYSFETEHFEEDDIQFYGPDTEWISRGSPAVKGHEFIPRMPWWPLITLFAFAPMLTAYAVTVATTRRKPGAR